MTAQRTEGSLTEIEQHTPEPQEADRPAAVPAGRSKAKRIVLFAVLAVVAVLVWRTFVAAARIPDNIIVLSGRMEGDDSAVAPKTQGRILEVRVREGDSVNAGDVLAILDDEQLKAREDQARAALLAAEAKAQSARAQIAVLQEQVREDRMQTDQAKTDADGRVRQAEADLAAAQADLAQQEASYKIASFDKDAYTKLAKSGAVSERQGLQAATTADQQAAVVTAARHRVEAAEGGLTAARANLENPNIRAVQTGQAGRQIAQQESEVASAAAQTAEARAQLAEAEANRQDLTVRAPFSGTIVTRAAEPGEVVTAGTAIVTMLDLTKAYLRGFVPEGEIGKVKAGQPAHIYLDSNPNQPIDAYVSRIDPQATFTPENTYFRDDRVKQVVGVKLQLKAGFGFAKPGMPADGEVLVSGDTWPQGKWR